MCVFDYPAIAALIRVNTIDERLLPLSLLPLYSVSYANKSDLLACLSYASFVLITSEITDRIIISPWLVRLR